MVIVPTLGFGVLFSSIKIWNKPLPLPLAVVALNQLGWLLVTVHCLLDITSACAKYEADVALPSALSPTPHNSSTGPGFWRTVIVRVVVPALTVIVPVLTPLPKCGSTLILNRPLPVRLDGVTWLTVIQSLLLVGISHVLFENISTS